MRGALGVAVLAAAVAAACGQTDELSRAEYERELQRNSAEIDASFDRLASALTDLGTEPGSLEASSQRVDEVRSEFDEAADELESVEPPHDADRAHGDLVAGLRNLSAELRAFREAVDASDVRRLEGYIVGLERLDGVATIDQAIDELQSQGYDIEDPG